MANLFELFRYPLGIITFVFSITGFAFYFTAHFIYMFHTIGEEVMAAIAFLIIGVVAFLVVIDLFIFSYRFFVPHLVAVIIPGVWSLINAFNLSAYLQNYPFIKIGAIVGDVCLLLSGIVFTIFWIVYKKSNNANKAEMSK